MEDASARWIRRVRHLALEYQSLFFCEGIGDGYGREQGLGIGVYGMVVDIVAAGDFQDLTGEHDGDAMRDWQVQLMAGLW